MKRNLIRFFVAAAAVALLCFRPCKCLWADDVLRKTQGATTAYGPAVRF